MKKKLLLTILCLFAFIMSPRAYDARYSLVDRGYNTPVRDQDETDICWTFATTESIMSNMQKQGLTVETFSPSHIDILSQDEVSISGFNTFHRNLNKPGNYELSSAYVMNNYGPVLESAAPFNSYLNYIDTGSGLNFNSYKNIKPKVSVYDVALVNNPKGACSDTAINEMKDYITRYGAIASLVSWNTDDVESISNGDNSFYLVGSYLNKEYYYIDEENNTPNHAITIVGWDDTIDPSKYSEGHRPSRKGAWIIKNSWGPEIVMEPFTFKMGDNGYYYIPYDDINICSYWAGFHNTKTKVSDYSYYYDYLGSSGCTTSSKETAFLANKFTKKSTENEQIDRVSFYSMAKNLSYEVFYSATGSLNSYQSIGSGQTEYPGYTSIIPNKEIVVSNEFAIIVKFTYADGSTKYIPLAMKNPAQDSIFNTYQLDGSKSFISYDGANWRDLSSMQAGTPVRVYTSSTTDTETNTSSETTTTPTGEAPSLNEVKENTVINNNTNDTKEETAKPLPTENNNTANTNNDNSNGGKSSDVEGKTAEELEEDDIENPKTGSSISWLIIIGVVLSILGVFSYTRNRKIYRL